MTIWRPAKTIKVKVLGLVWRGREILAAEVLSDAGQLKGVRPLGGSIEFGETREQALAREFQEELGCGISLVGPWIAFENLYWHEGVPGHEFIFAANIRLEDACYYEREEIEVVESDQTVCTARWFRPDGLPTGVELYPNSLAAQLALIANPPIE